MGLASESLMRHVRPRPAPFALALGALLVLLSACAYVGDDVKFEEKPYLFREAPDILYLTAFGSTHDVNPPSWFRRWIIGQDAYADMQVIKLPYGVAATEGRVYVNDGRGSSGYWVFNLADKTLELVQDRFLQGSTGLAIDERGYKYFAVPRLVAAKTEGTAGTSEELGRIVVYDDQEQPVQWADFPGRPIDIAIVGDRLYVTDLIQHRIAIVDKQTLEVVGQFGQRGEGDREFNFPKSIAADKEGRLYVGDMLNGRIKVFDTGGNMVSRYGYRATRLGSFNFLSGLAVDGEGRVYAVDSGYSQKIERDEIQYFDSTRFYSSDEDVPPIDTPLSERKNALLGWFQKPNAIGGDVSIPYRPVDVAIDFDNVAYFQHLSPPDSRIEYLIWFTSQASANGRNLSVFAYTVPK